MTVDDGIICPGCEDDLLAPKDDLSLVQCPSCRRVYTLPRTPLTGRETK